MEFFRKFVICVTIILVGISVNAQGAELSAQGSDSTSALLKKLAKGYRQQTGNEIRVKGGGSSKGAEATISGEVDLAFLSRQLKDSEKVAGLEAVPYARDGVAFVVNRTNPLSQISLDELQNLLSGNKTHWNDGSPVLLYNRDEDSGNREVIDKIVMKGKRFSEKASVLQARVIIRGINRFPDSLGYISAGEIVGSVKVLKVDGVAPTPEAIQEDQYAVTRTLTLATKGNPLGKVQAFIDFVRSDLGQSIIEAEGYVNL